jgi:hypothetical protein
VACAGTGLLVLGALALFPRAWIHSSDGRWRALGVYCLCTLIVVGPAYGSLVRRAGWRQVWDGITGYDQDAILLGVWPPWGTSQSWLAILSGLGVLLFAAVVLSVLVAPRLVKRHPLPAVCWRASECCWLCCPGAAWRS